MTKKQIKELLIAMNSNNDMGWKYPIGNKELTELLKRLENEGRIKYDGYNQLWSEQVKR